MGKSPRERQKCTERFKQIQEANNLIGDADSRRAYQRRRANPFAPRPSGSSPYEANPRYNFRDENVDAFYRAFAASQRRSNGDNIFSGLFTNSDVFGGGRKSNNRGLFNNMGNTFGTTNLKSTFVQKIKVPLTDLYKGRRNMEFLVKDNLWKSYSAVFRGGMGYLILYQSFLFAAPLLRLSKWIALAASAAIFHSHVPRLGEEQEYAADILAGYKEGTKLTFRNTETNMDVVFVLEEEPHDLYWREDNALHTTVEILASQAKEGCSIEIDSLNPMDEDPIAIKLRPQQIQQSGDTVTLKGKGWPKRRKHLPTTRGDLVVHFQIVRKIKRQSTSHSGKKKKRKRRRRMRFPRPTKG